MRKLFIGCVVVVVLILLGVGYITWRLYPAARELQLQWAQAVQRLDELDAAQPFDSQDLQHLDTVRFASMLDIREAMAQHLIGSSRDIEQLWENEGEDGPGLFDKVKQMLGVFGNALPEFAERLQAAGMGPSEFAWHTRLLWAALYRVDAGVTGPELEPLRGEYDRFREFYDRMARENKWPPLQEVIGEFAPAVIAEAATLMAADVTRVQRGLAVTEVDYLYMGPVNKLEQMQELREPVEESVGEPVVEPASGGGQ